jgi:hypothetical protein
VTPSWYDARPEPEAVYQGTLRSTTPVISPGGRTRLLFELEITPGKRLAIYAPAHEGILRKAVDQEAVLVGKIVNLSSEGHGVELWLGAADAVRSQ